MGREKLESAIETLKGQYFSLSWVYQEITPTISRRRSSAGRARRKTTS